MSLGVLFPGLGMGGGGTAIPTPDPTQPGISLLLEHSPAEIIRQLLVDMELATDPEDNDNWPAFVNKEPDQPEQDLPDNILTVYDTAGRTFGRLQPTGEQVEHYGIQIRVRSEKHSNQGFLKIRDIALTLDQEVYQVVVNLDAVRYLVHAVSRTSTIATLGKESPTSDRNLYTINYLADIYLLD